MNASSIHRTYSARIHTKTCKLSGLLVTKRTNVQIRGIYAQDALPCCATGCSTGSVYMCRIDALPCCATGCSTGSVYMWYMCRIDALPCCATGCATGLFYGDRGKVGYQADAVARTSRGDGTGFSSIAAATAVRSLSCFSSRLSSGSSW